MAKGKALKFTYFCKECNLGYYTRQFIKRQDKTIPVLKKFCRSCRKHTEHKAKELRKPVQK